MAGTALRATWNNGRLWLIWVVILSSPALLFVLLHLLYAPGRLPEFLDLPVTWSMSLIGMFGGLTTIGALIVTIVATFQRTVSVKVKVLLWSFRAFSFLACWYGSHIQT